MRAYAAHYHLNSLTKISKTKLCKFYDSCASVRKSEYTTVMFKDTILGDDFKFGDYSTLNLFRVIQ